MRIAFLFPGQGSQYPGMSKDFYTSYPVAKEIFEAADEILRRNLSEIILSGSEELLTETRNSQTGIYVASMAILRVVQCLFPNIKPMFCSGLSLGEYTAATAAGCLTYENALPLVQYRGQYMNDACEMQKGFMVVVLGLEAEQVELLVKDAQLPNDLWAANFNCPGQVVLSGTAKGVSVATALAKERGAKRVLPLSVHGAFHSGLMQQAQDRLADHVMHVPMQLSDAALVMNVSGAVAKDLALVRNHLISQVTHPVRWEQGIREIDRQGVDLFIEMGPGKTLTGFNKRIGVKAPTISIERIADLKSLEEALECRSC